ncbi:ABC transporter permease [Enterococcus sp. AZ109]|uniref:ABC transporter permease n=1 Tax=Enterococcus sp. AZ109 TaxID=2774634 RepID=UPI003F208001
MDFKQRALKSITRRKGKSLILFFVVFILGNVIAGAVAIQQSTTNVEKETKRSMGAVTSIEMDYEAYEKKMSSLSEDDMTTVEYPKSPKAETYQEIGNLSYVKRYDLYLPTGTGTTKLKSMTSESVGFGTPYMFTIKGFNQKEFLDVTEGLIKIAQGDGFTDNDIKNGTNAAIISQDVAEANSLSVGDSFVLDATNQIYDDTASAEGEISEPKTTTFDFPMKVAGIFTVAKKDLNTQQSPEQQHESEWQALDQLNTIYTTEGAARNLNKKIQEAFASGIEGFEEDSEDYYQATYVLKSPDDIEAFRQDANALLPEFYQVVASSDQYEQVAGGLTKLNTISKYVVIVAVIATLLILSLVVLLFMRDRKHELGIYLSFGESRSKVITQIVLELLMISSIALVLSLITGNFLGGAISQSLIQSDWISNSNQDGIMYYGTSSLMQNSLSFMDVQQAYKVTFSIGYIVTYLLVGVGTVLLSAILPLLYILRLNPKKIMM